MLELRKQQQPETGEWVLALSLSINDLSYVTKEACAILVKLSIQY